MQKFLLLLNAILGVVQSLTPFVLFPICLLALASAGAALLTGVLFAGWPAVRASRAGVHETMKGV